MIIFNRTWKKPFFVNYKILGMQICQKENAKFTINLKLRQNSVNYACYEDDIFEPFLICTFKDPNFAENMTNFAENLLKI